ncbi:MAG: hypothetical protein NVV74_14165 [Magnetospirillum sp.]|nr:hypothetical protein [Magnetospirillum sp.]
MARGGAPFYPVGAVASAAGRVAEDNLAGVSDIGLYYVLSANGR